MYRAHREPTGLDRTGQIRPSVPQNRGNGLVFELLRSKRHPIDREGCGLPQNGGNELVLEHYGRNGGPVHREGCGVSQNGTP